MKNILIKAGKNTQSGIRFPLCLSKRSLTFSFTESCKYNSGDQQSDLHKIFGIGVFHLFNSFKTTRTKKWWELHKWLSIRLGWRYNLQEDIFELTDYTYKNGLGERDTSDNFILKVKANEVVDATIEIKKNELLLTLYTERQGLKIIKVPCDTPKVLFFPFLISLHGYMGSGYTTAKDVVINTYKKVNTNIYTSILTLLFSLYPLIVLFTTDIFTKSLSNYLFCSFIAFINLTAHLTILKETNNKLAGLITYLILVFGYLSLS